MHWGGLVNPLYVLWGVPHHGVIPARNARKGVGRPAWGVGLRDVLGPWETMPITGTRAM